MSTAPAPRLLPPGLIRASFLASVISGPLWVTLEFLLTAAASSMPGVAHMMGVEPLAGPQPPPLSWLLLPLVAVPFTAPTSLLIVFPITALAAVAASVFFPHRRWPAWRRTWAFSGIVIGALVAPWIMTMWFGPSADGVDTRQFVFLGALDGACCALIAHRYAARRGAFDTGAHRQE